MNVIEKIQRKKIVIIIFCVLFAASIVSIAFFKTQQPTELELVRKYLNTTYTVTKSESADLFKRITSGSLTEKDTYKSITRKYARLMTKSGLQEAIESRQIWSNETIMAMNQRVLVPGEFKINKSEFYSNEKPSYNFAVNVSSEKFDGSEEFQFQPTGIVYLEKTIWGWKISRIMNDAKTSLTLQMQMTK